MPLRGFLIFEEYLDWKKIQLKFTRFVFIRWIWEWILKCPMIAVFFLPRQMKPWVDTNFCADWKSQVRVRLMFDVDKGKVPGRKNAFKSFWFILKLFCRKEQRKIFDETTHWKRHTFSWRKITHQTTTRHLPDTNQTPRVESLSTSLLV